VVVLDVVVVMVVARGEEGGTDGMTVGGRNRGIMVESILFVAATTAVVKFRLRMLVLLLFLLRMLLARPSIVVVVATVVVVLDRRPERFAAWAHNSDIVLYYVRYSISN